MLALIHSTTSRGSKPASSDCSTRLGSYRRVAKRHAAKGTGLNGRGTILDERGAGPVHAIAADRHGPVPRLGLEFAGVRFTRHCSRGVET
eukprot:scaffold6997_cov417-Prasinococcus_capsulatus_cf.AAC.1